MEKRNPMLKKAFEEAARKELSALPEEKFVIRPYSDKFDERMEKLFSKEKGIKEIKKKTFRFNRIAVAAIVAIMCLTVITAGAAGIIKTFSSEWRESLKENILNAEIGVGVKAFDKEFEKSTDPFAVAARESGSGAYMLLEYSDSIKYGITSKDREYKFYLDSVTKAQKKHQIMTGGSLEQGTATFEWVMSDAYYAIVEFSRTDGKKLSEEEHNMFIEWNFLIEGYEPESTNICFRGAANIVEYSDEYKRYYAVEITEMMKFAGCDFALVPLELGSDISDETIYADKDGAMELKSINGVGALIRFSVDKKYADKKAVKEFLDLYCMNEIK